MTSPRRLVVVAALLAAAFALAPAGASAQCAMCQTALLNSPEARGMGAEFNRAILVMLFAPYAVFGSIGAVLLRRHIAAAARQALSRVRLPWLPHSALRAD